jgi:hypothetical protein
MITVAGIKARANLPNLLSTAIIIAEVVKKAMAAMRCSTGQESTENAVSVHRATEGTLHNLYCHSERVVAIVAIINRGSAPVLTNLDSVESLMIALTIVAPIREKAVILSSASSLVIINYFLL